MIAHRVALYSVVIVIVSIISGSIPLLFDWPKRVLYLFVSFGAGVILSVAFVHMIPEAIEISGPSIGLFLLIGFSSMYVMEKFFMLHPCDEHYCDFHYVGLTALVGFSIHSFIAGLSLGSSMESAYLGWMVFVAIIIHKIPESFSLTTLLCAGKRYSKKNIIYMVLLFSIFVPLGMIFAVTFFIFNKKIMGIIITLAAGTFIEIAACDILPELHRRGEWRFKNLTAFILGLLSIGMLDLLE